MQEFPRSSANLPYALVRAPPIVSQPLQHTANLLPLGMRDAMAVLIGEIKRIHHFTVNIELELLVSCVSNAHRPRILIPTKMIARNLVQSLPAIDSIHRLQWPPLSILPQSSLHPGKKCFCFIEETQSNECMERKGRISQPGESVIPISHSANTLG